MLDLTALSQVTSASSQTFKNLNDQVNNSGFAKGGSNELLFGDRNLYWKPMPNMELSTPATKAVYRIMPQPYCDVEELQKQAEGKGEFNLITPDQYMGSNLVSIDYYQTFQKSVPSKGIKGGKFECISPTLWGEDDLLKKMLINIYMEKFGSLDKNDKDQKAERKMGYDRWVGSGANHRGYGPKNIFLCNVLVLKDSTRPEMEGEVWLYDINQATVRKKFFGDLESGDLTGSFLAEKDQFGDVVTYQNGKNVVTGATDILNALAVGSEGVTAGSAIQANLVYETKNFGSGDQLVTKFQDSKVTPYAHQTIFEDVAEFMFEGKNNKPCKDKVAELWKSEESLLKFYDRDKYYVEPQKMVDNFCDFMNIDERGNERQVTSSSVGSNSSVGTVTTANSTTNDADMFTKTVEDNTAPDADMESMIAEMQAQMK